MDSLCCSQLLRGAQGSSCGGGPATRLQLLLLLREDKASCLALLGRACMTDLQSGD